MERNYGGFADASQDLLINATMCEYENAPANASANVSVDSMDVAAIAVDTARKGFETSERVIMALLKIILINELSASRCR